MNEIEKLDTTGVCALLENFLSENLDEKFGVRREYNEIRIYNTYLVDASTLMCIKISKIPNSGIGAKVYYDESLTSEYIYKYQNDVTVSIENPDFFDIILDCMKKSQKIQKEYENSKCST